MMAEFSFLGELSRKVVLYLRVKKNMPNNIKPILDKDYFEFLSVLHLKCHFLYFFFLLIFDLACWLCLYTYTVYVDVWVFTCLSVVTVTQMNCQLISELVFLSCLWFFI